MATVAHPVAAKRFQDLVLDFLAYLEFERGLSRNTLEAYRTDLLQFGRYLDERDQTAVDATAADVSDFLTHLGGGEVQIGGPCRREAGGDSLPDQRVAEAERSVARAGEESGCTSVVRVHCHLSGRAAEDRGEHRQ